MVKSRQTLSFADVRKKARGKSGNENRGCAQNCGKKERREGRSCIITYSRFFLIFACIFVPFASIGASDIPDCKITKLNSNIVFKLAI